MNMDTMTYLDLENGRSSASAVKSRQNRLLSAPDQCLKTPRVGKVPPSARRALGVRNEVLTPASSKAPEVRCPVIAPPEPEPEMEEIEKFFPYDPNEFAKYDLPDVVYLSRLSLAGLGEAGRWSSASAEDSLLERWSPPRSPLKTPEDLKRSDEYEAFLQTITELETLDLPPEKPF